MKKKVDAQRAIEMIALKEGVTASEVREEMKTAMLAGMNNPDPVIQARWKKIPRKGEVPTPEELIVYITAQVNAGISPFM